MTGSEREIRGLFLSFPNRVKELYDARRNEDSFAPSLLDKADRRRFA
jgi:hypothetical protein